MASIFDHIRKEYEDIQRKNEKILADRKEEAHFMVPGLAEVEADIRNLGYEAVKESLKSKDVASAETAVRELEALEGYRRSLLLSAGLPADYLDPVYDCPHCKDKGYLEDGSRCICMRRKITGYLHRGSNIERQIEKHNFGNFRLDIFSDLPYGDEVLSPRENMRHILATAEKFVEDFAEADDTNLLFYGPTGQGKTFLSHAVAAELMARNYAVVYETAFGLVRIFEEKVFNKEKTPEAEMAYESIFAADLLIVDDLGTELSNSFTNSQLFNIINTRLIDGKKTIISTNLTPREISSVYGDRIFSRIFHKFVPVAFYGPDLRWESDGA
ncbi:DNA replication protein dnaC [Aedoeadaptatus ivorii]|uniref:DNA replication protein dnaC n=1 Tax=Aedoeadaptatus ivorii TaxID=54006 RepID=A0A448UZH2_9FIRM|nr:ATP-binding protein [Peptoniphilus ivorii]MDQ0508535.1 DNA replication protein DnaC [Peptoniphilus ivorii]VEJ34364.1 DNA replication protein dnaC [Peptoniphilus ivorii]